MKDTPLYNTKEIESLVDEYISQFKEGYFSPLALVARLTEEVGELAREMNHTHGEKPKKSDEPDNSIEDEIGDILFVIACITNSLGLDMSSSFHKSITKINTRDKNRWTRIDDSAEGKSNDH